jgi:hypothetical protein
MENNNCIYSFIFKNTEHSSDILLVYEDYITIYNDILYNDYIENEQYFSVYYIKNKQHFLDLCCLYDL